MGGHIETVFILIEEGANIECKNKVRIRIIINVMRTDLNLIKLLFSYYWIAQRNTITYGIDTKIYRDSIPTDKLFC